MIITDWRASSYSGGENNDCVEVANTLEALRDSKNAAGPALTVDVRRFIAAVCDGHITH